MVDQGTVWSIHRSWDNHFQQTEKEGEDLTQEHVFSEKKETVLSPEEFFTLRIGMKVRHPKFGEGRVKSIEGVNENQKATIVFQSVGSKRLKVLYAQLEILE